MKVTLALKTKPEWKMKTTALKHLKIWVCILHAVGHKFVYYLLCRYVSGVSPQNNAAQNWYCGMKGWCFLLCDSQCWDIATSCFILFWEEQYVVLFVAWTSAVFYWPFLLKNIIFSCFIIILADLFLKLRAVIFILLFKIYLFCNFWEDLECKRSRRHGRNVLLTVVEGVPTPLITHTRTHAHTHLQKFWFFCLVIYLNQGHHCARGQAELALTLYLLIYSRL